MVPLRRLLLATLATLVLAAPAFADNIPEGRRIGLKGYDPVSYFEDGKPMLGSREHWYGFDDVIYTFRSANHRTKFVANPERYAPQFAAYCAGGISKGYKVEPDPEAWLIANGKLFVFQYKDRVPMFRETIGEVETKARENWPKLRSN